MRKAAGKSDCWSANGEDWQMLVLGYRGTLKAEPLPGGAGASEVSYSRDEFADGDAVPPQMEVLTEALLADAVRELERRMPAGQRVFSGERIPVEGMLEGLRQRLEETLTPTLGSHLADAEGVAMLTEGDLAREFPWLRWLLRQAVSEWVSSTVTFCRRLQRDGTRLAEWMGVAKLPRVESVCGTTADTHPGGHAVLRVVLEGGLCFYYKPRAVTGEWLWHGLVEAIAELEPALRLPAGRVLEGRAPGRYGWMESVRPEDGGGRGAEACADGRTYWHAAGAMMCLAYHVALTDLHLGNLLATPGGPVVTDAECLGTPGLLVTSMGDEGGPRAESRRFLDSLLETGLLPVGMGGDVPDVSGLFGASGAVPSLRLPRWREGPDGRFRLTAAGAFLRNHGNAPGGSRPLAVMPDLVGGYREAAGLLLRAREALISPGSRWRCVLEHRHAPRVVVRDTFAYGLMLSRSLEPGRLGAGYSRRKGLQDELRKGTPGGYRESIAREELRALLRLHVPRLIVPAGTRTLASHSGRPLARHFAGCTPAVEVMRRMGGLAADDVEETQIPGLMMAVFRAGTQGESGQASM